MKGKICSPQGVAAVAALVLLASLPGCRKLGLDDTPRVTPDGAPLQLGPKRQPMAQHSSVNTNAALRTARMGALSPEPSSMASITPNIDPYAAYAGNNFWANGNGWSATPASTGGMNAVPPTPQMMPPAMNYQMPMQQAPMMANPNLPSLSALAPAPSPFSMMPQQMPQQQQAYNNYNNFNAPVATPPQYSPVGSFGMQQTPQAPQQFSNNPNEFPRLQDTPNSPFYRSQQEIAGDINSLQNQSLGNGWQNTPSFPTSPAGNFSQPVALQDNYGYGAQGGGYGGGNNGYDSYASGAPAAAPYSGGYDQQAGLPQNLPPYGNGSGMNSNGGFGGAPAPYDSAGFVPPAPIAGVAEAPVMAQDWDRNAYNGQQGGGSAYGVNGQQPMQLQAPYGNGQSNSLPSSRYQGRSTARSGRAGAVPATMDYGGY